MKNKIPFGGRKLSLIGEKSLSIIDHKAYRYWLDNSKIANRQDVSHYVEHGKILSELYCIIGEKIVESEGGVFIDGLGYFGVLQAKKGLHAGKHKPTILNTATNNIIYNICFVPISKNNNLKPWSFEGSFMKSIRENLKNSLRSGKKYSFNASLFFNRLKKKGNDL